MMWLTFGYFDYYLYMIPALALVMIAQAVVSSRYSRFSRVPTARRITGQEMARWILQQNGITDVVIQPVSGRMTDHYHPAQKVIRLSEGVYDSASVAAVSIAAHEAGHAVQHARGYAPARLRSAILPVCNVASRIGLPLAIIGFIFNFFALVNVGLVLFAAAVVFQLVTLPVELDASHRALAHLRGSGWFTPEEAKAAKSVLTAAAMTYVAALAQSVLQLLYFATRFSRRQ